MARHIVTIHHVDGKFIAGGDHGVAQGRLDDLLRVLLDHYPRHTAFEIIDAKTGNVMHGPDDPWTGELRGLPRPLAEAFESKRKSQRKR